MVTNNIGDTLVVLAVMVFLKIFVFLPVKFLPRGKIKKYFILINELYGVWTFYLFISAFTQRLILTSLVDARHTIGDQNA